MVKNHPLQEVHRPDFESGDGPLTVVDLFSGCGGLSLGAAQAANARGLAVNIPLAVDFDDAPIAVLKANFPDAGAEVGLVESYFNGVEGSAPTPEERSIKDRCENVDLLIGGPPCQGHSNLNNHTRRNDPKNRLYFRMARAAEVLRPRVVIIENVPAVVHDSQRVVDRTTAHLRKAGYVVSASRVEFTLLGIPQMRKRHALIAIRADCATQESLPDDLLKFRPLPARDLRWAIGDLAGIASDLWVDCPSKMSSENRRRIQWLIDNDELNLPNHLRPACHQGDHSYVSMYGRLAWHRPAQTITSGFGSLGQGRYGHPSEPRTLTPHEAARIQGFPDYFKFDASPTRSKLATIIGNAVPPALTHLLTAELIDRGIVGEMAGAQVEESA